MPCRHGIDRDKGRGGSAGEEGVMSGIGQVGSRPRPPGRRSGAPAGRDEAEGTKVGCTEAVALGAERKTEYAVFKLKKSIYL